MDLWQGYGTELHGTEVHQTNPRLQIPDHDIVLKKSKKNNTYTSKKFRNKNTKPKTLTQNTKPKTLTFKP